MSLFSICVIIIICGLYTLLAFMFGSFEGYSKGYRAGYNIGKVSSRSTNEMISNLESISKRIDEFEELQIKANKTTQDIDNHFSAKKNAKVYPSYLRRIK